MVKSKTNKMHLEVNNDVELETSLLPKETGNPKGPNPLRGMKMRVTLFKSKPQASHAVSCGEWKTDSSQVHVSENVGFSWQ